MESVTALAACPVPITIPLTTGIESAVDLTLVILFLLTVEVLKPVSREIPAILAEVVSILMTLLAILAFAPADTRCGSCIEFW